MENNTRKRNIEVEMCSFGDYIKDKCHKHLKAEIKDFETFSDQEQTVYKWRA